MDEEFELAMPFWIDTEAYSDKDRTMFVCGYEFAEVYQALLMDGEYVGNIHKENESRIRMMAGKLQKKCIIESIDECWSSAVISS